MKKLLALFALCLVTPACVAVDDGYQRDYYNGYYESYYPHHQRPHREYQWRRDHEHNRWEARERRRDEYYRR